MCKGQELRDVAETIHQHQHLAGTTAAVAGATDFRGACLGGATGASASFSSEAPLCTQSCVLSAVFRDDAASAANLTDSDGSAALASSAPARALGRRRGCCIRRLAPCSGATLAAAPARWRRRFCRRRRVSRRGLSYLGLGCRWHRRGALSPPANRSLLRCRGSRCNRLLCHSWQPATWITPVSGVSHRCFCLQIGTQVEET